MRALEVGDKVKVRMWSDMEKEFVYSCFGGLETPTDVFNKEMGEWCGKFVTVSAILPPEEGYARFAIEEDCYVWDETMIEEEEEQKHTSVRILFKHGEPLEFTCAYFTVTTTEGKIINYSIIPLPHFSSPAFINLEDINAVMIDKEE